MPTDRDSTSQERTRIFDYLLINPVVGAVVSTELYFTIPQKQFITCEIAWRTSYWPTSSSGLCLLYLSACLSACRYVSHVPDCNPLSMRPVPAWSCARGVK